MTEPLDAARSGQLDSRPARARHAGSAAVDRLAGRWPATDQLTRSTTEQAITERGPAAAPAALESPQPRQQPAPPISLAAGAADADAELDLAQERRPTFAERMAAIDVSFSNPSTGETSVDGPLVTIDVHELNVDTDAPVQRQYPSAPRLR